MSPGFCRFVNVHLSLYVYKWAGSHWPYVWSTVSLTHITHTSARSCHPSSGSYLWAIRRAASRLGVRCSSSVSLPPQPPWWSLLHSLLQQVHLTLMSRLLTGRAPLGVKCCLMRSCSSCLHLSPTIMTHYLHNEPDSNIYSYHTTQPLHHFTAHEITFKHSPDSLNKRTSWACSLFCQMSRPGNISTWDQTWLQMIHMTPDPQRGIWLRGGGRSLGCTHSVCRSALPPPPPNPKVCPWVWASRCILFPLIFLISSTFTHF